MRTQDKVVRKPPRILAKSNLTSISISGNGSSAPVNDFAFIVILIKFLGVVLIILRWLRCQDRYG
jgi:hypothetical protein